MSKPNLKSLFIEIWEERPHLSEVSGRPLLPIGHWQWHWQFAHILTKGAYPSFKFRKDNIILMLPEEHEKQESFASFIEKREELKRKYYDEQKHY
jgi:hypothetical protein